MKSLIKFFSVTVMLVILNSCAILVVGGIAAAGISVFTDARTAGAQLEDKNIFVKAHNRIHKQFGNSVDVSITSYDRDVLLTGFVPSEAIKTSVEEIVKNIKGVTTVYNELYVGNSISVWRKAQDSTLIARIRAELLAKKNLSSNFFKVTANNSIAYVMGIAPPEQKQIAIKTISEVSGVQEVVAYIKNAN